MTSRMATVSSRGMRGLSSRPARRHRATSAAWSEYWQPAPRPGWHDLLALTKREQATLEGDLHPFMTHLQYFKDVLALPRRHGSAVPA